MTGDDDAKSDVLEGDTVDVSCEMVERSVDPDSMLVTIEEVGITRTVTVDEANDGALDGLPEAYKDAAEAAGLVSEARTEDWRSEEAVNVTLGPDGLETGVCGSSDD